MSPARLCVIGTGYVGTANAIGFASMGHTVVGYDILPDRLRRLAAGVPPYQETGLADALRTQLDAGRLTFTPNLSKAIEGANVIILALPTPTQYGGAVDLSALNDAVDHLLTVDLAGAHIVLRSTVPPGTTDALQRRFGSTPVLFVPEFLREGFALADFLAPSRTIVGTAREADARAYVNLLAFADERPIYLTAPTDAETIKAYSNAFLATKISFANEVANFCAAVGADAPTVLAAIGADPRIGSASLSPGIGFGGPCLTKDVRALQHHADLLGVRADLLDATLRVNERQPFVVVEMLRDELGGSFDRRRIAVWGLAFKAGTDDVRHSLAVDIVAELHSRGASIVAFDPAIKDIGTLAPCTLAPTATAALMQADALLVLTDWPIFRTIDPALIAEHLRHNIVVDGRNCLDHRAVVAAGLRYRGVGRLASPVPHPRSSVTTASEVITP